MTVLSVEGQQRAKEALKRLDEAIISDQAMQEKVWNRAKAFRDDFFATFDLLERDNISFQEIALKLQRVDTNQFLVKNGKHTPFLLILDTELAYYTKPLAADARQAGDARRSVELSARLFAVFEPPHQGVLRYYTIFADGSWMRTVFAVGNDGEQHANSALATSSSADVLMLEAIDLLGKACMLHPSWADLAKVSDTLTADRLRDRTLVKKYLSGR